MIILTIERGMIQDAVTDEPAINPIHILDLDDREPELKYLPIKHDKGKVSSLQNLPTTSISVVWKAEDIRETYASMQEEYKESWPNLTDEQVGRVLDNIEQHHDCTLGITWDTVECAIQEMLEDSC